VKACSAAQAARGVPQGAVALDEMALITAAKAFITDVLIAQGDRAASPATRAAAKELGCIAGGDEEPVVITRARALLREKGRFQTPVRRDKSGSLHAVMSGVFALPSARVSGI
jgi:hypothetical protein